MNDGVCRAGVRASARPRIWDVLAAMPLALLRLLSQESLPLILTSNADIEATSILVQAGHVKAPMQVVFDPRGGGPQPGMVVSEITRQGWRMLEAHTRRRGD